MSFRLLSTRLFKHGRLIVQNYFKRDIHINILDNGRNKSIPSHLKAGSLTNYANYKNQGLLRFGNHARRLFVDNILNRVTNPYSAELRAQATKKLLYGDSAPFFALVGVSLASGAGILTKEDEMEGVCWEIRDAVSRFQSKVSDQEIEKRLDTELGLDVLDIGPPIAKGCSAVVYAASLKQDSNLNVPERMATVQEDNLVSPIEDISRHIYNFRGSVDDIYEQYKEIVISPSLMVAPSPTESRDDLREIALRNMRSSAVWERDQLNNRVRFDSTSFVSSRQRTRATSESSNYNRSENDTASEISDFNIDTSLEKYPLALKMMFNYDIQSNAMAILKAMHKETVPAKRRNTTDSDSWENMLLEQTVSLPSHPNIVEMFGVFCDQIPDLRKSKKLYPMALPPRINPNGYGRNMSLFLLMKRYDCSLQQYLSNFQNVDMRTRILLFTQLLEAIAHLSRHGVAHRDIKSDNILIEINEDMPPILVLSDFGCCIADKKNGLQIPYSSNEIDKGGNTALMAPEIITKTPGIFSVLNYGKSDLWACGTIAYEIFGQGNPFYGNKLDSKALKNTNYDESSLPTLSEGVPWIVRKLVENVLQKSPSYRLDPDIAANVMQLFLWAPSYWLKLGSNPSSNEILQWLLSLTTKILCEGRLNVAKDTMGRRTFTEYLLITSFLARAQLRNIRQALNWIHSIL